MVLFTGCKIQSVEEYNNKQSLKVEDEKLAETKKTVEKSKTDLKSMLVYQSVTIEIRVDTILKNYDKLDSSLQSENFVPSNGIILQKSKFELNDGETAFDILLKATRENRIHMSFQGSSSKYINGINNIYEFSCGDLSGWMYKVNGTFPNSSTSAYKLNDGDAISFNYTCNLGRDLGQNGINQ